MINRNRKPSNRRPRKWRGLEALETRMLMSADSLPTVDGDAEMSAAVIEDSLLVDETPRERVSVQYRETDFNFVSRLMEEEGIFHFFKHEDGKHTFSLTERDLVQEDHNAFTSIPDSVTFQPAPVTPKPLGHEVQASIVTGPAGEEIHPDEFGRVRLQFNWDRDGETDDSSSCWIRVSQIHAGKTFGDIDIPRIGEEVIVEFEHGDPDRPIIVGRAYHTETMPPFGLPGAKNVSGLKSNSTQGSSGYNEFILNDTKDNEIREHGQFDKDSTIEHDLREHVLNDRVPAVTNNETITIGVDRTETVGTDKTEDIGSNHTAIVGKNESVTVALMRTHTVGVNEMINVGAAQQAVPQNKPDR